MCPFIIWLHCHSRYSASIEGHDISFAAWYYIKQTMLCTASLPWILNYTTNVSPLTYIFDSLYLIIFKWRKMH